VTPDDTEDDGCYGTPTVLVWRDAVQVGAVSGSVPCVTAAETLIASQGHSAWGEQVGAELVGFQTARECLVPGCDLCSV
jgi:hypothetical protein